MAITLLPTPPSRQDPANFNVRADEFLGALPTFGTEANSLASDVNSKQVTASNAATTATTKANEASDSALTATTKAGEASASASAAESAKIAAEAAFDLFDDRYLGQKSSDPTADNDGGTLLVGALYFRTTAPVGMKVWTGTAWDDAYANLSSKFDKTGGDVDGNINFTGTGRRITGDFSNATVANRTLFRTSTANAPTSVGVIPNGANSNSNFIAFASEDLANAAYGGLLIDGSFVTVEASKLGSGAYLPLAFNTGGSQRLRIDPTTGNILATSGALGYGVGAGGTVVQATSKSTGVTLNKPSGRITTNNAALAAGASVIFILTNSTISITDEVSVTMISGGNYRVEVIDIFNGGCAFRVANISASSLSDALAFNFKVFKVALT